MMRSFQSVLLSILYIALPTLQVAHAVAIVEIPAAVSDSEACGIIERAHARGLEIWRAGRPTDALEQFKACEAALKKRSLWMPPKLPEKASEGQKRALRITNQVIFSLAAVYQQLGRTGQSESYADMARERGLLPKVITSGRKRS